METLGEQLLIPLIHRILLGFPPSAHAVDLDDRAGRGLRTVLHHDRAAYDATGGAARDRQIASLTESCCRVAYRSQGLRTDLFDASDVAECRMAHLVLRNVVRSPEERDGGFAKMPFLPVMTVLLSLAFLFPVVEFAALEPGWSRVRWCCRLSSAGPRLAAAGLVLSAVRRGLAGCVLHPLSVVIFLVIQWTAWSRKRFRRGERGRGVQWRSETARSRHHDGKPPS